MATTVSSRKAATTSSLVAVGRDPTAASDASGLDTEADADDRDAVARDALEPRLRQLRSEVADPRAGLFGPGSRLWQVNRHAALFLGGGRAALLQLAHPAVAQAIVDHSTVQSDPFRRFQRTFAQVFAMVYGDLDSALDAARRVSSIHGAIRGRFPETVGPYRGGSEYSANDPEALLWVHATLWETSVAMYELFVASLSAADKETYYRETRRFADLFGIDRSLLPADWSSFVTYNEHMWGSARLTVSAAAREVTRSLFRPRARMPWPVAPWYRTLTAGLMPERLRRDFALPFGSGQRVLFGLSLALLRPSHRLWPRRLRLVPAYVEAMRRLDGEPGRDRVGEWLSRLYVGRPGK